MNLEIITPEKSYFNGEVVSTTLPGLSGSFQLLKNHAPIISALGKGKLSFMRNSGEVTEIMIEDGFVETLNNRITVCVDKILKEMQ